LGWLPVVTLSRDGAAEDGEESAFLENFVADSEPALVEELAPRLAIGTVP
jgi:hypothetical protein